MIITRSSKLALVQKKYSSLCILFEQDVTFKNCVFNLSKNKLYFQRLNILDGIKEVRSWLYQTNMSVKQTELNSKQEIELFALYLLLRFAK